MHAIKRTHGKNNTDGVCRLCSSNSGIIVLNIFDGEGKKRRVLSLINACLPVKVHENDPLPKVICHNCLHKLEVFREFQESCLKSEETLRNCVSCSLTVPVPKSVSREYVHEDEKPVPQFSAELNPVQDPLLPHQIVTAISTPEEEDTDDCVAAVRSEDIEHSLSSQVEVVVKEEPECQKTESEDESRWLDTSREEDNVMQTEEAEVDLLPPDDINSAICATPIVPPVIRTLSTNKKVESKNFLHQVGRSWISEVQNRSESSSDDPQLPEKPTTPRGPKQDPPGRLFGDFGIHKLEKIVGGGEGKRKYPSRQCKVCAVHKKRSETRYICKFCVVPLHKGSCFERYHTVKDY